MSLATVNHTGPPILTGLSATGSSQGTAFPLVNRGIHEFTTVSSSTGAILPVPKIPSTIVVTNDGASSLSVYPPSGGTVAGGSTNAAYSLGAGTTAVFVASSLTNYYLESTSASGSGGGITGLTGDVTTPTSSSGSTAATLFGQTSVITPTLASSTNNWSPTGFLSAGAIAANVIRASVTASVVKLTGLAAPTAGGLEGAVVTLQNALGSTNPLHLVANSGSSTAGNQFSFLSDVYLAPGESLQIQYDNTQANWREFGPHKPFRADLWGTGVSGAGPTSSQSMTQVYCFTDWIVPASVVFTCENFDIYVNGTLDISLCTTGTFGFNGSSGGSGAAAGTGGTGAASGNAAIPQLGQNATGQAGGAGTATNGAAGAASATARYVYNGVLGANGGAGGAGGTPGNGTAGAGGGGESATAVSPPCGLSTGIPYCTIGTAANTVSPGLPGSSGGGGGGDGTNPGGGGGQGGSTGGFCRIFARNIYRGSNTNTGIFQALGGAGGAGGSPTAGNAGGGGGGGGGQGGFWGIVHDGVYGSPITGAVDVTGGAGGAAGTPHGTGGAGTVGYAGPSGSIGIEDMRTGTLTWLQGNGRQSSGTPVTTRATL
jgi:hypothetical protein